jgi:peptidoglycan/xylan/chitin deacetylase (PgdA/CDA1 family)
MIRFALRLDDPSETSDHGLEREIIRIIAQHRAVATFAVVPFSEVSGQMVPLSQKSAAHLVEAKRAGFIEVAMHGFSHLNRHTRLDGKPSEFRGVPEVKQAQLIRQSLDQMQALFSDTQFGFVPPWNSYDAATARELERNGFKYLSADWEQPDGYRGALPIVPRTCHISGAKRAVEEARRFARLSPIVVAMLHHYDFTKSGNAAASITLPEFDQLLGWLRAQPDVIVQTLGQIASDLDADQCKHGLVNHALIQRMHWRMQAYLPTQCFVPLAWWRLLVRQ